VVKINGGAANLCLGKQWWWHANICSSVHPLNRQEINHLEENGYKPF